MEVCYILKLWKFAIPKISLKNLVRIAELNTGAVFCTHI